MSREQNLSLSLEYYSLWSPCIINYGRKSRNEMCEHSVYCILNFLYSRSGKLFQSSVKPVVNLSHVSKLVLRELNSTNPAKIVRKCLGTERFSQISRIPRQNVSHLETAYYTFFFITLHFRL